MAEGFGGGNGTMEAAKNMKKQHHTAKDAAMGATQGEKEKAGDKDTRKPEPAEAMHQTQTETPYPYIVHYDELEMPGELTPDQMTATRAKEEENAATHIPEALQNALAAAVVKENHMHRTSIHTAPRAGRNSKSRRPVCPANLLPRSADACQKHWACCRAL